MNKTLLGHFKALFNLHEASMVQTQLDPEIAQISFLQSLDALIQEWPFEVSAHLPDLRDEVSSETISTAQAHFYFDQGMGLLFNDAHRPSPVLSEYLQIIRRELGLSALTYGRCLIYATPDGKGTAPHFDQNINFVLQIHGTKIWTMAPNTDVENPLTRHTMGLEPDPEMMSYLEKPLSTTMPQAQKFELKPGSLLYVPRGYWHSTEAEGDALALNFTFTAPAWLDLLTAALRGRLAQSPEWRETAMPQNQQKFEHLLELIKEDLTGWKVSDILSATEPEDE
jgi:50S ribosomal protein L16 3-hydroxylase